MFVRIFENTFPENKSTFGCETAERERLNVFNHVDLHDAYKCERRRKAISSLSLFSLSLSILLSPPLFL
jgi:hypothetical protein